MVEWSIASDLKSEELKKFREFESHSLLKNTGLLLYGLTFFFIRLLLLFIIISKHQILIKIDKFHYTYGKVNPTKKENNSKKKSKS